MDLLYNYTDRLEVPAEGPVWGLSCITHILDKLQSSYSQQNLRLQTSLLGNYHSLFTPSSEFNLSEHTKFRLLFDWEERRTRRDGILCCPSLLQHTQNIVFLTPSPQLMDFSSCLPPSLLISLTRPASGPVWRINNGGMRRYCGGWSIKILFSLHRKQFWLTWTSSQHQHIIFGLEYFSL